MSVVLQKALIAHLRGMLLIQIILDNFQGKFSEITEQNDHLSVKFLLLPWFILLRIVIEIQQIIITVILGLLD